MKKVYFVVLTVVLLSFASPAFAGLSKGKGEVGGFFSLDMTEADDSETLQISGNVNIGKMLSDAFKLGFRMNVTATDSDEGNTGSVIFVPAVEATFHFVNSPSQTHVPYVGIQAGAVLGDMETGSMTGTSFGVQAGLKVFPKEDLSVNVEVSRMEQSITFSPDAGGSTTYDQTTTQVLVGMSVYFE